VEGPHLGDLALTDNAPFYGCIAWGPSLPGGAQMIGHPVPVVFSIEQADEAMREGNFQALICVAIPRAKVCVSVADAARFFNEGNPP
jgi:hypothetical protein